jgi:hypothetical protein
MEAVVTGQFIPQNSNESGTYCPMCRDTRGQKDVKLVRLTGSPLFKCSLGHEIPYGALQAMHPDLVPFIVKEQPNPALDVKPDMWLRTTIWNQFSTKYAGRVNATLNSVLATMMDDDFLLITGETVRKLHKSGVRKQEDILALVEENTRLVAENEQVSRDSQRLASLFANAAKGLQGQEAE